MLMKPYEEDEREDRSSYKDFSLDVFRNHIYQEEALIKHFNLNHKGGVFGKSMYWRHSIFCLSISLFQTAPLLVYHRTSGPCDYGCCTVRNK